MYYKRIDSGAVDAKKPENRGSEWIKKWKGRKWKGEEKGRRERKRDSGPCIVRCIEAHPESILTRIDSARAYLVDNGIPDLPDLPYLFAPRTKGRTKKKKNAVTQCTICARS